jgi:hypothetical protein
MKTCTVFAATAVVAMLSLNSASAMRTYLKKFPNGEAAFTQALGHVGETEKLNDFGKLFSGESNTYTEKLCKSKFPGADMTVGEAFGDPCCTWKAGGKPDFTVEPFTVPTKKTVCAASAPAASSAAPAPAASASPAPATPTVTPAAGGKPGAGAPPAGKPGAGGKPGGKPDKCGVKRDSKGTEEDSDDGNDDDE